MNIVKYDEKVDLELLFYFGWTPITAWLPNILNAFPGISSL